MWALNVKYVNFDHASPSCRGALKRARSRKQERYSLRRGAFLKADVEVFFAAS